MNGTLTDTMSQCATELTFLHSHIPMEETMKSQTFSKNSRLLYRPDHSQKIKVSHSITPMIDFLDVYGGT